MMTYLSTSISQLIGVSCIITWMSLYARLISSGVRGVMCSTVTYISNLALAEAMAARKWVEFARRLGLRSFRWRVILWWLWRLWKNVMFHPVYMGEWSVILFLNSLTLTCMIFLLFVDVVIVWPMKLLSLLFLYLSTNCGLTLFLVLCQFASGRTIVILAFNETMISFQKKKKKTHIPLYVTWLFKLQLNQNLIMINSKSQ